MIFRHAIRVGFKHELSRKFPLRNGCITEVICYMLFFQRFYSLSLIVSLVARTHVFGITSIRLICNILHFYCCKIDNC